MTSLEAKEKPILCGDAGHVRLGNLNANGMSGILIEG